MRIPVSRMYDLFHRGGSSVLVIDKDESVDLLPYFSSREGALISRIILCGFTFQEKIIGVLLIADSPYLLLEEKITRVIFTVLEELSSSLLYASREDRMRKTREPASSHRESFLRDLREIAEGGSENLPVHVLTINAAPLIDKIREYGSDLDEYRTFQDISAVSSTILDGIPLLAIPEKKRILFAVPQGSPDIDLLIHQLSLAIKSFFQELKDIPDIDIRRTPFGPPDTTDMEAFVDALLA